MTGSIIIRENSLKFIQGTKTTNVNIESQSNQQLTQLATQSGQLFSKSVSAINVQYQ